MTASPPLLPATSPTALPSILQPTYVLPSGIVRPIPSSPPKPNPAKPAHQKPGLLRFEHRNKKLTQSDLNVDLSSATVVDLRRCTFDQSSAGFFKKCPKVEALYLNCSKGLTADHMNDIAAITTLTRFEIGCSTLGKETAALIAKMVGLRTLNLVQQGYTNTELELLAPLKALRTLDLSSNKVSNLQLLTAYPLLETLILRRAAAVFAVPNNIAHLKSLKNLKTIDLQSNDTLKDSHLLELAELQALTTLDLSGCKAITQAGIAALRGTNLGKKDHPPLTIFAPQFDTPNLVDAIDTTN